MRAHYYEVRDSEGRIYQTPAAVLDFLVRFASDFAPNALEQARYRAEARALISALSPEPIP
jgi:hypothetical protein